MYAYAAEAQPASPTQAAVCVSAAVIAKNKIMKDKYYVGLDGDSIGRVIESLLIKNSPKEVVVFSQKIILALEMIKKRVTEREGEVLFCSGDSILFYGEFDVDFCKSILEDFRTLTGRTASIGMGRTTSETYLGMKLAKSRGGNNVEFYQNYTEE
jgi:hypothetical protein